MPDGAMNALDHNRPAAAARVRRGEGNGESKVLIARRFEVDPARALPALDQPHARAFAVTDLRGERDRLYALLTDDGLAPRSEALRQLERFDLPGLQVPLEGDIVDWPPAAGRRCLLVFEQPEGERLAKHPGDGFAAMNEDTLSRCVIEPLLAVLRQLRDCGLTHRAIRASNLYFGGTRQQAVLGECVSAPPGLGQPPIYEPIDALMASAAGRGSGGFADDLYAFGVLLAILLHGRDPTAEMDEEALLQEKIARGSYAVLAQGLRLSLPMMEVLRALLCDDPRERWSLDELLLWAGGRHLSPRQPVLPARGNRACRFDGQAYWSARALGAAMGRSWTSALDSLGRTDIVQWIHRSIGDEDHAKRVASVLRGASGAGQAGPEERNDRVLSRLLMALDPAAPLRYRDLAARPEALAQWLAVKWDDPQARHLFGELVAHRLPQAWLEAQRRLRPEHAALRKVFDKFSLFISRPRPGYGIERCLYEYNPGWPCLSPLLREDYVTDLPSLLPALERRAAAGPGEQEPIDRHIAAFVAARLAHAPERTFNALAIEGDEVLRRLGMLHLLADVQRRCGPAEAPALAAWMRRLLGPVIESYNNRPLRESIVGELDEAVAAGDLGAMALAVDNPDRRKRDAVGFEAARRQYQALAQDIQWLERGGLTSREFIAVKSQHAAAIVAGSLSGLAILILTLGYVT